VPKELAVEAGLLVPRDRDSGCYDRFRGRVIFPIRDLQGRTVSLGGRILGDGEPKYLNGPESPVFSKSRALYNLDQARPLMRRLDRALLVEGYFDVITCAAHGFGEAVAPMGTALTAQQVRAIKGQAREVVLVFDGDQAGRRAARRALPILLADSLPARVLLLPPGDDPDTFLRTQGAEAFALAIKEARPLIEATLDHIVAEGDAATPEGRSRIVAEAGEVLGEIRDPVTRDGYLRRLAGVLGMDVSVVTARLGLPSSGARRAAPRAASTGPACLLADDEAARLQLALCSPNAARVLLEGGALGDLTKPEHQAIAQAMGAVLAEGGQPGPATLSHLLTDATQASTLARLAQDSPQLTPAQAQTQAMSCLAQWNKRQAKHRRAASKQDMAAAQARGDQAHLDLLQARRAGRPAPSPSPLPPSPSEKD
jgi:DNA primase